MSDFVWSVGEMALSVLESERGGDGAAEMLDGATSIAIAGLLSSTYSSTSGSKNEKLTSGNSSVPAFSGTNM